MRIMDWSADVCSPDLRQIVGGPPRHARQHGRFDGRVEVVELARRPDQQLSGRAWLRIEGDRRAALIVGALYIAELQYLAVNGAWITIGNQQVDRKSVV